MKALSINQLLAIGGANYPRPGRAFFRFFNYEVEGQPAKAWQVKEEGWADVFYTRDKDKNLRLRVVMHGFTDWLFERNASLEDGYEFDGHGFVFFFENEEQANAYIAYRKAKFTQETKAILGAIQNPLLKRIARINVSPDAFAPLCTIFYVDGTKLAVSLPGFQIGTQLLRASDVIDAVSKSLGGVGIVLVEAFKEEFGETLKTGGALPPEPQPKN